MGLTSVASGTVENISKHLKNSWHIELTSHGDVCEAIIIRSASMSWRWAKWVIPYTPVHRVCVWLLLQTRTSNS